MVMNPMAQSKKSPNKIQVDFHANLQSKPTTPLS